MAPSAKQREKTAAASGLCALLVGVWIIATCISTAQAASQSEIDALLDLYNSTNGGRWAHNNNWGVGDPCKNVWFGIYCSSQGSITQVNLYNNGLSGTIPPTFGQLLYLQKVYLENNNLFGAIPDSFGNIGHLNLLNLSNNSLSGTIPESLTNLVSINTVNVEKNNLSGTISESFGRTNIQNLYFGHNKLSGTIPENIGNPSALLYIDLSSNSLTGTIPMSIASNTFLQNLNISNNKLSGSIYGALCNRLYTLDFSNNVLSGSVPESLGNLKYLNTLYMQNNNLTGTLPSCLQNPLPYTYKFDASNNQFSCPLPTWCSAPPTGNGLCAPCGSSSTKTFCCTYSNNGCASVTGHTCSTSQCPQISGLSTCGIFQVTSCSQCSAPSLSLDGEDFESVTRPIVKIN